MRAVDLIDRLEHQPRLDGPAALLRRTANRLVPFPAMQDLLHGVWLGHPLHPMAVQLPIGAWLSSAVTDLVPGGRRASTALVATGLAASFPTAMAGLTDAAQLHTSHRRVAAVHAASNLAAAALYGASLVARLRGRERMGTGYGLAGLAAVTVGGYLGGHLSYRQASGANHAEAAPHRLGSAWQPLGRIEEFEPGKPAYRQLGEVGVFVFRQDGQLHALVDTCTHLGGPLHAGSVEKDDAGRVCVRCPWHGSTFRLADGSVVHGPATSAQPLLSTRISDGVLEVRAQVG